MYPKRELKKPKGFKPGSKKGRWIQYITKKIKEAKENGAAWVTYQNLRLKIIPPTENYHGEVFIKDRGNIHLVDVVDKDGLRVFTRKKTFWQCYGYSFPGYTSYHIQPEAVLAMVVESHERKSLEDSDEDQKRRSCCVSGASDVSF